MSKSIDFVDPTPLYEQIIGDIKNRITRGDLKPGEKLGTHKELAREYQVSLITVKNAMASLVKDQVLFTRVGKGTYVADQPVKKLAGSDERMLGLVLGDLNDPFFSMVLQSLERRAAELGYHLLLSSSSENTEREETQIARFRDLGVQGLVIASLSYKNRAMEQIERLHNDSYPYVMISYIHDPVYWHVGCDQEYGGFLAAEHLIKTGYKSIGYVHVGKGNLLSEVRKNGYVRALVECGLPFVSERVYYAGTQPPEMRADRYQLGFEFAGRFATLHSRPEALCFYNDLLALGFIQGAIENGIRVPEDIAIVGFDDLLMSRFASVPLTTVRQPMDAIGKWAVDVVHSRINGMEMGNRITLKPTLIVRVSCGARRKGLESSEVAVSGVPASSSPG